MNREVQSIIKTYQNILSGQPWFGRAVYELLADADQSKVHLKPNDAEHSLLELVWHMNTWAAFTLANLQSRPAVELKAIENDDWRLIDSKKHSWQNGVKGLKSIHKKIISTLSEKNDSFLKTMVPNRQYNFRFMLNGLIQHTIYHAGQIAYINKL